MSVNLLVGWFDDTDQSAPSSDPPRDGACMLCGAQLVSDDVRTHSLMYRGEYAARSYFYRTHRTCGDIAGLLAADGVVLDIIKRMEQRR